MKRAAALVLACAIVIPGTAILGPRGATAHARTLQARTVPLESASLEGSNSSTLLTQANPGHFEGHAINAGLQLAGGGSYALFALGGRYATLSGTVFDDDYANGDNATLVVVDMSVRDPRVLYRTNISGNLRAGFQISVRGVGRLALEETQGGGVTIDVVASLTPGRHVRVPTDRGTALESLPVLNSGDSKVLSPSQAGAVGGVLIMHGIQLEGDGAYVQYALGGRYTVLSGTMYDDDYSNGDNVTFVILDTSGRKSRVLFRANTSLARTGFRVSVRGVRRLTIEGVQDGGAEIDVVASVS